MFPTRALLGRSVWKGKLPVSIPDYCAIHCERSAANSTPTGPNIVPYVQPAPNRTRTLNLSDDELAAGDTNSLRNTDFPSHAHSLPRPTRRPSARRSAPRPSCPTLSAYALLSTTAKHTRRFRLLRRWLAGNSANTLRM